MSFVNMSWSCAGAARRRSNSSVVATPVITVQSAGSNQNGFTGYLGFKFTANINMTVQAIGRRMYSGNSGTHTGQIRASDGTTVLASNSIPMSGTTVATDKFVNLGTFLSLTAGTDYFCVTSETSGADSWADAGAVTYTAALAAIRAAYFDPSSGTGSLGTAYGTANFTYF